MSTKNKVKFRCSGLGKLTVGLKPLSDKQKEELEGYRRRAKGEGRPLTERQLGIMTTLAAKEGHRAELSKTAKGFVEDTFIVNEYGVTQELYTDPIIKGKAQESAAIALVSKLEGVYYKKNERKWQNDWIQGTLDVDGGDHIKDIKVPKTVKSFLQADLKSLYYAQGQGYMWLTGIHKFSLTYVLMPDPEDMINRRLDFLMNKLSYNDYKEAEKKIRDEVSIIENLPRNMRVKEINFNYDQDYIDLLKQQIEKAREYYDSLFVKFGLKA